MIRKYLCILSVLCLILLAAGCKKEQPATEQSYPTLPEFREDLTPLQQLSAAIEKVRAQRVYDIQYGTKVNRQSQTEENSRIQNVSPEKALDRVSMMDFLPYLPQKDGFLDAFCNNSLRIIPSNTGLMRFQLSDLTWEQTAQMMYDQIPEGAPDQASCEIAFEIDAHGRLSKFEVSMTMDEETLTAFLSISFPEET